MVNTRYTTRHNLPEYNKSDNEKPCGGIIPCTHPIVKYQDMQNIQCPPREKTSDDMCYQKTNKHTDEKNTFTTPPICGEQCDPGVGEIEVKKANVLSMHSHFSNDSDNDQDYVFVK
tara:strand:- start:915 stop:1262 length:348 start_codon:yes stop_codon:yes gene_type:complete